MPAPTDTTTIVAAGADQSSTTPVQSYRFAGRQELLIRERKRLAREDATRQQLLDQKYAAAQQAVKPPEPLQWDNSGINSVISSAAAGAAAVAAAAAQMRAAQLLTPDLSTSTDLKGNMKGKGKLDLSHFTGTIPSWYKPQLAEWHGVTMQVDALAALRKASEYAGHPILGGGFRTYQAQVDLYHDKPDLAAKPGTSWHELGLAIDLNSVTSENKNAMLKANFKQFSPSGEPWHFSYREAH